MRVAVEKNKKVADCSTSRCPDKYTTYQNK